MTEEKSIVSTSASQLSKDYNLALPLPRQAQNVFVNRRFDKNYLKEVYPAGFNLKKHRDDSVKAILSDINTLSLLDKNDSLTLNSVNKGEKISFISWAKGDLDHENTEDVIENQDTFADVAGHYFLLKDMNTVQRGRIGKLKEFGALSIANDMSNCKVDDQRMKSYERNYKTMKTNKKNIIFDLPSSSFSKYISVSVTSTKQSPSPPKLSPVADTKPTQSFDISIEVDKDKQVQDGITRLPTIFSDSFTANIYESNELVNSSMTSSIREIFSLQIQCSSSFSSFRNNLIVKLSDKLTDFDPKRLQISFFNEPKKKWIQINNAIDWEYCKTSVLENGKIGCLKYHLSPTLEEKKVFSNSTKKLLSYGRSNKKNNPFFPVPLSPRQVSLQAAAKDKDKKLALYARVLEERLVKTFK
jgi:hypothetical protein